MLWTVVNAGNSVKSANNTYWRQQIIPRTTFLVLAHLGCPAIKQAAVVDKCSNNSVLDESDEDEHIRQMHCRANQLTYHIQVSQPQQRSLVSPAPDTSIHVTQTVEVQTDGNTHLARPGNSRCQCHCSEAEQSHLPYTVAACNCTSQQLHYMLHRKVTTTTTMNIWQS